MAEKGRESVDMSKRRRLMGLLEEKARIEREIVRLLTEEPERVKVPVRAGRVNELHLRVLAELEKKGTDGEIGKILGV